MEDNAGKYLIYDGDVKESVNYLNFDLNISNIVYEVIRQINSVPLFFEDHYERMNGSVIAIGDTLNISLEELKSQIVTLLKENDNSNCNVKINVFKKDGKQKTVLYISKSYYPSDEQYNKGVSAGLIKLERLNPNVKLINQTYKQIVNEKMQEGGFFEVLLVNNEERITEGSKSNIFFVKENKVITTPGLNVLKGVTRKYVIEACKSAGYEVVEQYIEVKELEKMEGVFLSGTSIKVLPISNIDEIKYKSSIHPVVISVKNEYDKLIKNYIDSNGKIW